ncbi:U1 small nuclear ribonucleoprotein C-like [Styela clava]|uniref:U1 small nuclear ribonucleoprotein C-like n=1 Tax=Styela clava TaxID=7725 RepID=UPI0019399248|nr:U1 small nuclear ribonucleoprotein C-like [Styela clava]
MPKYYCDYCDTYLTHDSPSVRKTHCSGRKHKDNVRVYYQTWMEEQAQALIDKTTKEFQKGKIQGFGGAAIPPPGAMMRPNGPMGGPPMGPGMMPMRPMMGGPGPMMGPPMAVRPMMTPVMMMGPPRGVPMIRMQQPE